MINDIAKPKRPGIIEKDYQLHRLLCGIKGDEYLSENLAFKGGTCLIKAHLGYYRFSEDVDFTWKDRSIWDGRSRSRIKKACSKESDEVIRRFHSIADDLGLEFAGRKDDLKEVRLNSGGRMIVLFMEYHSEIFDRPDRIKIEINFVEDLIYPVRKMPLRTYLENIGSEEIEFLFEDEYSNYSRMVELDCYDPREIFLEKCRAAMTRKVYKLRDIIDIFYLEDVYELGMKDLRDRIISKTRFSMDLYRRYSENVKTSSFPQTDPKKGEDMDLMIIDPPQTLFDAIPRIHDELVSIRDNLG